MRVSWKIVSVPTWPDIISSFYFITKFITRGKKKEQGPIILGLSVVGSITLSISFEADG